MVNCRATFVLFGTVCLAGIWCAASQAADIPQDESLSDSLSERIVSVSQGWGELGLNTSVTAGQKSLKLRIKDTEYARGLGHHANGEIVVDLGGQFQTFQAEIGIQWQDGDNAASVVFQVYVDNKKAFDSGVMHHHDAPRPVAVSVAGAKELRLVANDAGDGISFDCANWADARLIRNPAAPKEAADSGINIVPFGQVLWWDPKVMTGTKAGRVHEFPADDVAPYKEILPAADGTYTVPTTDTTGCIGLQWDENRMLRRLMLTFSSAAAVPPIESIQLQSWTGASAWQGQWQPVVVTPTQVENRLIWSLAYNQVARGTQKVRWVFSATRRPIILKDFFASTRSRCDTMDVRIESARPDASVKADIDIYNGVLLDGAQRSPSHCAWDNSKPLTLKIRFAVPQRYKVDRTVLRFRLPHTAFGVAIEDLLTNEAVYVPHAGVFVTRLPVPVTLADYLKKIAGQKTVLQQVRDQPDQDFARAWSVVHNPIQDLGPMMLSLANDNRKFTVGREGTIWFDEYDRPDDPQGARPGTIYTLSFNLPWRCAYRCGSKSLSVTRHVQGEWLPIPVMTAREGSVEYRQTTCVAPVGDSAADAPPWFYDRAVCVAEYRAANSGDAAAPTRMALSFGHAKNRPFQLQEVKEGLLVVQGDRFLALIDTRKAAPLAVKREAEGVVLLGDLPGGATARCLVYIPGWKVAPQDYLSLLDNAGATTRVESYWTMLLDPAMQIEIPNRQLSNIIRASQVHCLLAARNEKRGAGISAWTAAAVYGPLESESNSIIRGMDMTGHTDFARRSLEFLLSYRTEEGFITTGYTIVGTGEVLWTLAEHYERTHDRAWMKHIAPEIVRICQWITRQREKTKRLDARAQKVPEYGLMPPGVSADWDRYAYRFFNDAHYYAGLEASARMLADIGDPAAPSIRDEAERYREDIVRAYHLVQARMPVVKLANGTWVPADPAITNCLGRVEDFLPAEDADRTWGYSVELGAHQLAATGVLAPDSQETDWIADYLEDVQFLRSGWGDYPEEATRKDVFSLGGFAKLQPYYCRIAELYALRDEVKPFIRSYFNTIPVLVSAENLSFWEHLANRGAWNKTHETGWFLCQTRIMFVDERGDDLWLAPFVTNQWLKDGMKIAVRNAPTRCGPVGYTINSAAADGRIEATIRFPTPTTAKRVVLRLRHPEGKLMRAVTVNDQPHTEFDARREIIVIQPAAETIAIRAQY